MYLREIMSKNEALKSISSAIKDLSASQTLSKKIESISISLKANPTIIAADLKINGNFDNKGLIEIEGDVSGVINGGSVILHKSGKINNCDVFADYVSLSGEFDGNIKAQNVNITNTAKVSGIIEYTNLSVEDGACIDGQFKKLAQ